MNDLAEIQKKVFNRSIGSTTYKRGLSSLTFNSQYYSFDRGLVEHFIRPINQCKSHQQVINGKVGFLG